MRKIFIFMIIMSMMAFNSCIIIGSEDHSGEEETHAEEEQDSEEEVDDNESESLESEADNDVIEEIANNIMFHNNEADFAFIYSHNDLTLSSYSGWNKEYSDLCLNVSITDINTLEGAAKEAAIKEREALENGDFGDDGSFSFEPSRKVINIGDVAVKEYMVLGRYEICDVVFERRVIFYNNDYQVQITLIADKDKIIEDMEQFFTHDEENCSEEKIWKRDGKERFYDQLLSGQASNSAMKWHKAFEDIIYLLQINDYKGASAGYSRVTDKRYYEDNMEENYIIDIAYPQFQSAFVGGLDETINILIRDEYIASMIEGLKREIASYEEDLVFRYSLAIDYQIISFDENIISICLDVYPYLGGAHGMLYFETINYDINNIKIIELEDLFESGYDYAGAISEYCRNDLNRQILGVESEADEGWIEEGTDSVDDLSNFLIAPYGLIIKFPAYQVAAYAGGDFSVIIPYSQFEGFIDPDSAISDY